MAVYGGFAGGETQLDQRDWALAQSGVSYTINFYDNGKSGKSSSDTFGIRIVYTPVTPQPSALPNATPQLLKGGDIKIS